ncbi:hypothetical protein LCGC14_1096520 [marine sediment metagenome]|uniref:Uncharacterized protein n=1 Tax=marine sediment metagenome TaxID=412755 RepID=A0A0F9MAT2_9ZZZZ
MSFLKNLKKVEIKPVIKKIETKPTIKQIIKQKKEEFKQDTFKINPEVKNIPDIPNTNIMTSGKLIGIRLRANKKEMLGQLRNYIDNLLKSEKK